MKVHLIYDHLSREFYFIWEIKIYIYSLHRNHGPYREKQKAQKHALFSDILYCSREIYHRNNLRIENSLYQRPIQLLTSASY